MSLCGGGVGVSGGSSNCSGVRMQMCTDRAHIRVPLHTEYTHAIACVSRLRSALLCYAHAIVIYKFASSNRILYVSHHRAIRCAHASQSRRITIHICAAHGGTWQRFECAVWFDLRSRPRQRAIERPPNGQRAAKIHDRVHHLWRSNVCHFTIKSDRASATKCRRIVNATQKNVPSPMCAHR